MTNGTVAHGIDVLLCAAFLCGLLFLVGPTLWIAWRRLRMMRRLELRKRAMAEPPHWLRWIRQAVATVFGGRVDPLHFGTVCACFGFAALFVTLGTLSVPGACLAAICSAALPVLLLGLRFSSLRRQASFEGEALVSCLLRLYRICDGNLNETLEQAVAGPSPPRSRHALGQLLRALRQTGDPVVLRLAVRSFGYAINTRWSRQLAHSFYLSASRGMDIAAALEDLLVQLRDAGVLAEERKRLNSEAVRMTYLMAPLLYGATVFLALRYLEMPASVFLQRQFATPQGLSFFLLICLLIAGTALLLAFVQNRAFDV